MSACAYLAIISNVQLLLVFAFSLFSGTSSKASHCNHDPRGRVCIVHEEENRMTLAVLNASVCQRRSVLEQLLRGK